jgi:hypothetical protein
MRSSPKVPILVRVARGRDTDVVTNPQEPHRRIWIPPSSSSVARFAMSVIESKSSISAELSIRGLLAVE